MSRKLVTQLNRSSSTSPSIHLILLFWTPSGLQVKEHVFILALVGISLDLRENTSDSVGKIR